MKKIAKLALYFFSAFLIASGTHASERSNQENAQSQEPDCVAYAEIKNKSQKISTRLGKEIFFKKNEIGQITLMKINGVSYIPTYDENLPSKVLSIKNEVTGNSENIADFSYAQSHEARGQSKPKLRHGLRPCRSTMQGTSALSKNGDVILTPMSDEGDEWPEVRDDWQDEYGQEEWWDGENEPYYEEAYESWELEYANWNSSTSTTAQCVDRAGACSDKCDDEGEKRGYACIVFAVVFAEAPPLALAAAVACAASSDKLKGNCKASCPSTGSCF
ncbi:hypothetical protein [Pseudoduganella aquatica]|uniref:hypothetical protein n=1 Tax=Pseudoduganella aquatica TaxID=2660641 RepID=UPI001E4C2A1B|nr:hypothetical protein [Pseudoduganella aquatica]